MLATRTARLFKNGASQAVCLPHFRFEGDEVYATRDEPTGDVILSSQPSSYSWAALFERHPPAIERRLAVLPLAHVCVSAITRAELMYGLARLPKAHHLHVGVRAFLRMVGALPWDGEAADRYAAIRHDLTRSGHSIGELDMMIAAHALAANAVLVTNSAKHYARIEAPLQLANWADTPESAA